MKQPKLGLLETYLTCTCAVGGAALIASVDWRIIVGTALLTGSLWVMSKFEPS
jgi:hypothetical protein